MAIITCPKCPTKLRVPDGSTAAVRCPKCQTVFNPPKASAAPAFEIVDEPEPPKSAKPAPRPASPPPPPPQPAKAEGSKGQPFNFDAGNDDDDDDAPRKKPKRATARRDDDEEDDDDDRPRKKRRREEDDDDDRPRSRKRDRDDDDEDERPRSRKRGRDDDDDDDEDDDRPRKKKRKYGKDRDDDDDWAESGSNKKAGAGAAKTGMLMLTISLGLYLGTFVLFGLFTFVSWMGGFIPSGVMILPGLFGLGSLITSAIGLAFCIAGPARSRGLAIGATAVAGVHLAMAFVVANNTDAGMFSPGVHIQLIGYAQKAEKIGRLFEETGKNPSASDSKRKEIEQLTKDLQAFEKDNKDDIKDMGYYLDRRDNRESRGGRSESTREINEVAPTGMRWADAGSQLGFFTQVMEILCFHSKLFGDYLLSFFAGLLELAQIALTIMLIGSVARAVKQDDAAGKAKIGLIAVCIAVGVAILLCLLNGVLWDSAEKDQKKVSEAYTSSTNQADFEANSKKAKDASEKARSSAKLAKNFFIISSMLSYLLYSGMLVMPALGALQTSSAAGRQARYRR